MSSIHCSTSCFKIKTATSLYFTPSLLFPLRQVSSNDFKAIEDVVKSILKEKQPFERCVLTKQQLLDLFAHNPFKRRIIEEKVQTDKTTAYRCGPLIDLCRGPHIRNTGKVKAFQVTRTAMVMMVMMMVVVMIKTKRLKTNTCFTQMFYVL